MSGQAAPARQLPKRARWLNNAERSRLVARYEGGAKVSELAAEFAIGKATVSRQLNAAGVVLRKRAVLERRDRQSGRAVRHGAVHGEGR